MTTTAFEKILDTIVAEIPFNPQWANGTGYLNGAVSGEHAPKLASRERAMFVDNHGRRAIVVGTTMGNAVVFERYTKSPDNREVLVCNLPDEVGYIFDCTTNLTEDKLHFLVGDQYPGSVNVGHRIERMFSAVNDVQEDWVRAGILQNNRI